MQAKAIRTAAQRAKREAMALRLPGLLAEHGSMAAVARAEHVGDEWLRAVRDGVPTGTPVLEGRFAREHRLREERRALAARLPGLLAQYSTVSSMCRAEGLNRKRVHTTAEEFGVALVPGRKYVPHPPPRQVAKPRPEAVPAAAAATRAASGFVLVTAGFEQRQARALAMFQRAPAADPAEVAQAAGVPLHVAFRLRRVALGGLEA